MASRTGSSRVRCRGVARRALISERQHLQDGSAERLACDERAYREAVPAAKKALRPLLRALEAGATPTETAQAAKAATFAVARLWDTARRLR